jgi:hypothetical protein
MAEGRRSESGAAELGRKFIHQHRRGTHGVGKPVLRWGERSFGIGHKSLRTCERLLWGHHRYRGEVFGVSGNQALEPLSKALGQVPHQTLGSTGPKPGIVVPKIKENRDLNDPSSASAFGLAGARRRQSARRSDSTVRR